MDKNLFLKRKTRVRNKMTKEGYRLSLFRSNRYLFAQIIEIKNGKVILGLSEKKVLDPKEVIGKTKCERAKIFGGRFGKEAIAKKMKQVVFDRGAFRYHGRVKAFAEGAREGGLVF